MLSAVRRVVRCPNVCVFHLTVEILSLKSLSLPTTWSAFDHIELTYHDVIIFAIPEIQVNQNSMVVKYKQQNDDDTGAVYRSELFYLYCRLSMCIFIFFDLIHYVYDENYGLDVMGSLLQGTFLKNNCLFFKLYKRKSCAKLVTLFLEIIITLKDNILLCKILKVHYMKSIFMYHPRNGIISHFLYPCYI